MPNRSSSTPHGPSYRYGARLLPLARAASRVPSKEGSAVSSAHRFTVYHSHHGPIVRAEGGKWIAVKIFQDPVRALAQSYLQTKTTDYASFRTIQEMRTDTSNNTVYADADGTIAYFHGNFIPRRDPRFDFTRPVDGSDPATEWHGCTHRLDETITLGESLRMAGFRTPTTGRFPRPVPQSPKRENYPRYMWTKGENPRGIHAVELLQDISQRSPWTV